MWRVVDDQGGTHALQLLGGTLSDPLESRLRTLRKVSSPNLLKFHELRKLTDGRYVAIFEYLDGQDLEVLRAGREFSPPQVNFIALSLARGLAALHEVGLSHGDISAANVMVTAQGRVVLVDLLGDVGTTRAFSAPEIDGVTGAGTVAQLPDTEVSPSGGDESVAASQAADVYAMAQVLLTLGMDPGMLKAALNPVASSRPRAGELADSWQSLSCCGIDLLDGSELMSARMRAAGRDVATEMVSRSSRRSETALPGHRQRCETRPPNPILRWGLPALAGAALALGAVLFPRLGELSSDAQALPAQSATPSTAAALTEGTAPSSVASRTGSTNTSNSPNRTPTSSPTATMPSERLAEPAAPEDTSPAAPPADLLPNSPQNRAKTLDLHDSITDDASAREILQLLLTTRDEALTHQDRSALEKLSVKDSLAGSADMNLLESLQASQAQIEGLSTAVKSATVISANKDSAGDKSRSVRLAVTLAQGAYTQIDRIGNRHQIAAIPDTKSEILLSGNPWRIAAVVRLD